MTKRLTLIALTPLLIVAAVLAAVAYLWFLLRSPSHAWRIAVGVDQLANVALKGSEDETISSRASKGARRGVLHWCVLCKLLDAVDPQHCEKEIEADEGKPLA
jgi:hypothetical protein